MTGSKNGVDGPPPRVDSVTVSAPVAMPGAGWISMRPGRPGSLWVRHDRESVVMRLAGEADFTDQDQLLSVLGEAVEGEADVYLDVSGLSFVDVAATRALLSAAANLPAQRRMILIEPCHALRIILSSAGFRLPEQLVLVGRQPPLHGRSVRDPMR